MSGVDPSVLCPPHRNRDNAERALHQRGKRDGPLPVARILPWEFRPSARFQAFRHRSNPRPGFPLPEAEKTIAALAEDLDHGTVAIAEVDFMKVLALAERLSKRRACDRGHRRFAVLHTAAAPELEAGVFLSFDGHQNALAAAEGMANPLAVHSAEM